MQIGFEEDGWALGVPSHPQRRAHPRGDCCLGQRISSHQDKTQIRSFPPFQTPPGSRPSHPAGMCILDSSQSRIPVLVSTGCFSLPPPPRLSSITSTHKHACARAHTHTHTSHTHTHSQAVTYPHMDTRASSDPHAHRMFIRPPWPFPASTCFSPASFSSAFSLWFRLLINRSHWTLVGPPPRCGNTCCALSLRDMQHTHLTLAGNLLLLSQLSTSFRPHPAEKQSKRSGFSRAFSIPGTGQSFVTLKHKNYFPQVSDDEIKAQRCSVTHLR